MKAAQASSSATLLVSMMTSVNLRRMERSRKARTSVLPRPLFVADDPRQNQQLRADLQPGARGRVQVDCKPHLVLREKEMDHATGLRKPTHIAHGEHSRAFDALQNPSQMLFL